MFAVDSRPKSQMVRTYEGRWRWWYEAIADRMLANPHATIREIAASLGKHENTISAIYRTDMFKAYYEERKAEWRERHDTALLGKINRVAEASLDLMLEHLETKRTSVPIGALTTIANSALDRLGYGPKPEPSVQVTTNVVQAAPQVTSELLLEARAAMRAVEAQRAATPSLPPPPSGERSEQHQSSVTEAEFEDLEPPDGSLPSE